MAVKVTVMPNGPLRVEADAGEVTLQDGNAKPFGLGGRTAVSLCRCGLSANKPFCDGAHRQGFASVCEARDLPAPAPKA